MSTVHNLEWLNLNSERNYPLAENASRLDTIGAFTLPNSLIVDAVLVAPLDTEFYIHSAAFLDSLIVLAIYDQADVPAATVTITVATHQTYTAYPVVGVGQYTALQGKLVIGNLAELDVIGNYTFALAATRFEATCVLPNLRGVTSLAIAGQAPPLVGDVQLVAGYNCQLRLDTATNTIYIDAIEGSGLGPICNCTVTANNLPIKTVNGILPTNDGNFDIRGVGCINVTPINNGIQIVNTCESICCDCADIEALELLLADKQAQITALLARVVALGG